MGNCHDHSIHILHIIHGIEGNAIQTLCLICICCRIYDNRGNSILLQFFININHLGISRIRTVLLEGKSKDSHLGSLNRDVCLDQVLYQ